MKIRISEDSSETVIGDFYFLEETGKEKLVLETIAHIKIICQMMKLSDN